MTSAEANEKRLLANEIMRQLYDAAEGEQLRILVAYGKAALEILEKGRP